MAKGFVEDRSMVVAPDKRVVTEWIDINLCYLANRTRMDFAAIERAGRRLLQMGDCQSWPPVNGHWTEDGTRFAVCDGRHEYLAALALGRGKLFVAWIVPAQEQPQLQLVSQA